MCNLIALAVWIRTVRLFPLWNRVSVRYKHLGEQRRCIRWHQALSASVPVEKLGSFIRTSANMAKVGFTDTATSVDLLSTAVNAYGLEADQADNIANKLVNTQNLGKTSVNELASSMGKVIPTAAGMNVNLDQLCTMYTLMTKQGIATAESTTYMNSMLNELGDSGTDVGKVLKEKTGKSFQDLMKDGKTTGDALKILKDYSKETGKAFNELWGSQEAGNLDISENTRMFCILQNCCRNHFYFAVFYSSWLIKVWKVLTDS